MPSFDVVSQVNQHELRNAVDQTNREVSTRFDFKGTDARVEQQEQTLTLHGESEFQVGQVRDILLAKMARRELDIACLDMGTVVVSGKAARQVLKVREGIDAELAKDIVKRIKATKLKVQAAIQAEQVRVSGKKRDELQQVIAALREADLGLPVQFVNFRD
jgi:uncharacterized protein YajQ (UPF0234 family)